CACNGNDRKSEVPAKSSTSDASTVAVVVDVSGAGTRKFPKGGGPHAPFAIAFVVDQLSAWVAEERFPLLPETGGFARLRREGTWAKTMRLPYSVTDTAPGHASLHTGRVPAESGIFGNELPDPTGAGGFGTGRITFLRDPSVKMITPSGVLADS